MFATVAIAKVAVATVVVETVRIMRIDLCQIFDAFGSFNLYILISVKGSAYPECQSLREGGKG